MAKGTQKNMTRSNVSLTNIAERYGKQINAAIPDGVGYFLVLHDFRDGIDGTRETRVVSNVGSEDIPGNLFAAAGTNTPDQDTQIGKQPAGSSADMPDDSPLGGLAGLDL